MFGFNKLIIIFSWLLNSSIWVIDKTLTGTTTSGPSGPGSNGNKGVLFVLLSSLTGPLQSDTV